MQVKRDGIVDQKLEFLLGACKKGVQEFVKAIEEMDAVYNEVRFKAFTIKNIDASSRKNVMDILSTGTAIELKNQRPTFLDVYTMRCEIEETEDGTVMWLVGSRDAPEAVDKDMYEKNFAVHTEKEEETTLVGVPMKLTYDC